MDALSFLQSVTRYGAAQNAPERRVKLGTVDPTYVSTGYPSTLPKITFDGESTLSGKMYPVVGNYLPAAGDRVALVPVGTTYAIVGALDSDASTRVGGDLYIAGAADLAGTLNVEGSAAVEGALGVSGVLSPSGGVSMDGSEFDRGAWTYYAATWTASSSNPTINLSTPASKYRYKYLDDETVRVQLFAYFASGSSKGSGAWYVSTPVAAEDVYFSGMVGSFVFNDSGVKYIVGAVTGDAGTNQKVQFPTADGLLATTLMTGTFVGSWIRADFTYRIA